jgi:hypothetical protein
LQNHLDGAARQFEQLLKRGCRCADAKAAALCANLLALLPAVWRFVVTEGIEPTNNHGVGLGLRFAALDKSVRTSSPCVCGVPLGWISGYERRRSVWCAGLRPRWGGYWRRFLGENRWNLLFVWVGSPSGVAADASGGVHLGKIGLGIREKSWCHFPAILG